MLRTFRIATLLIFLGLWAGYFQLQVLEHQHYAARADRNAALKGGRPVLAKRVAPRSPGLVPASAKRFIRTQYRRLPLRIRRVFDTLRES